MMRQHMRQIFQKVFLPARPLMHYEWTTIGIGLSEMLRNVEADEEIVANGR